MPFNFTRSLSSSDQILDIGLKSMPFNFTRSLSSSDQILDIKNYYLFGYKNKMYYLYFMEESIKHTFKIDELWNNKRNRNYVWGRMVYVYYFIYVEKRSIEELISINLLTKNQIYYLIKKCRYNIEKNEYFKSLYINVLEDMIIKRFNFYILN